MRIPGTFGGKPLPISQPGRDEIKIGYRGHEIPIPTETMRTVYANPPGAKDPSIFLYFLDGNGDVGRIEFPRTAAERFAKESLDLITENKPQRTPIARA